jgi:hypothetical protein
VRECTSFQGLPTSEFSFGEARADTSVNPASSGECTPGALSLRLIGVLDEVEQ